MKTKDSDPVRKRAYPNMSTIRYIYENAPTNANIRSAAVEPWVHYLKDVEGDFNLKDAPREFLHELSIELIEGRTIADGLSKDEL